MELCSRCKKIQGRHPGGTPCEYMRQLERPLTMENLMQLVSLYFQNKLKCPNVDQVLLVADEVKAELSKGESTDRDGWDVG